MARWTLTHDEWRASPTTAGVRPSWVDDLERAAWSSVPILITGTSAPLLARIEDGAFDEALFYRLNALQIVVDEAAERCSRTGGHVT
jgi:hypothetical protein